MSDADKRAPGQHPEDRPRNDSHQDERRGTRRAGGRKARQDLRKAPKEDSEKSIHPGLPGGRYRPLAKAEVLRLQDDALEVLATIGMGEVPKLVRDLALAKGCSLSTDDRLLFPRSFVEDIIAGAAKEITLFGRIEKYDLQISDSRVHYGTGGAAVQVLDLESGAYRPSTLRDLYDFARLADTLDNVHWFTRNVVATDVTEDFALDVNTAYAILAGTQKHVGMSFVFGHHVKPIVEMFDAVLGADGVFRRRPCCKVHISPVISPLRYGEDAVGVAQAAMDEGMPINAIIAAQSGATAPATLAGMLIQTHAETLAGLILVNLFQPGYPVIFSNWPFVIDLRSGAFACGGAEIALLNAAAAQLANHCGLPSGVAAGMADSKIPDAQAGYEKAISALAAGLAGANLIYESSGMFASLLGASFEGFVMDNDIVGLALRILRGIEVNEETCDLEVIRQAVTGPGHFLAEAQTIAAMERDYFYPEMTDRDSPEVWEEAGAKDAWTRYREKAREILDTHHPGYIPRGVDARIRAKYDIRLAREEMEQDRR
jgi:trimethylamine--corrinoid protein Co-methyltransferase